ncbi:MAG: endonuclease/exonuclease/phosphatase family protein [Oscillospiraceae bacterium]|jgi:endonuclease/exonuclease/phosphatase family metal-dependent hydrolase|nr:endonuclease/exonuclease/phosphatase family protein [Oscillospiraceae bacterium]
MEKIFAWLLACLMSWGVSAPTQAGEATPPPQELTVMSFNVWTDKNTLQARTNGVMQTILKEMPDSVGLQEAHARWRLTFAWELRERYGMACWIGRDFAFDEGVPILYNKEKYRLLRQGVFWLSETPDVVSGGWDTVHNRIAGYAVLQDKQTGFTYVHFNTHFDNLSALARENSATLLLERIQEFGDLPVVITGDLNTTSTQPPVQTLLTGGLRDTRELATVTDTGATMNIEGATPIDFVLVDDYTQSVQEFKVIREQYDGRYPSDHYAVCATFTLSMTAKES